VKSLVTGLPLDLRFRTTGQLAIDVLDDAYADGLSFDFACEDEVYGSCPELREFLEVRSAGQGSKGDRWYAWAWIGTASARHSLLVHRHGTNRGSLSSGPLRPAGFHGGLGGARVTRNARG
jgi:hypothetical protein